MPLETATFAAGCFWGVEEAFRHVKGVAATAAGYTGGNFKSPTYEDVCTGRTGHAEAVQMMFDTAEISYEELLDVFWGVHDPTQKNRQGPDIGTQYRSAIFFHNKEQERIARKSKAALEKSGRFSKPVSTEIAPAGAFYKAEEYHQQFLRKGGLGVCH